MKYNAMMFFPDEEMARKFAEAVGSDSWGWMEDVKSGAVRWYVDYNE